MREHQQSVPSSSADAEPASTVSPGKRSRTSQLGAGPGAARRKADGSGAPGNAGGEGGSAGGEPVDVGEILIAWALPHEDADAGDAVAADADAGVVETAGAAPAVQLKRTRRSRAAKKISTTIPKGATIRRNLSAVVSIANASGTVTVVIKPDAKSSKLPKNDAETKVKLKTTGGKYNYDADKNITSFTPFAVTITIQTFYGAKVNQKSPSGYGRGTTAADKKAGNTTLKFHEGSHGSDYLAYLKSKPLPTFKGAVGDSETDWLAKRTTYFTELQDYVTKMKNHSKAITDCVGTKASFCKP